MVRTSLALQPANAACVYSSVWSLQQAARSKMYVHLEITAMVYAFLAAAAAGNGELSAYYIASHMSDATVLGRTRLCTARTVQSSCSHATNLTCILHPADSA